MVHKPGPERKLSMKSRLIIIAIMFVIINLVFYFGIDSSEESESLIEIDNENQMNVEKNLDLEHDMTISVNP
jgi:cell division protein YceG involved in septum cleavage